MFVHKILLGANAGLYLPFALSRLRALEHMSPGGYLSQKFSLGDYDINVTYSSRYQSLSIIQKGGYYFEFFTSGKPVTTAPFTQGAISGTGYLTATVGGGVTSKGTVVTAAMQVLQGKRFADTASASAIQRPQQLNLINEPVVGVGVGLTKQPTNGSYPRLLYESYAPVSSHTGVYYRGFNTAQFLDGGSEGMGVRDVGFDVPWQDGKGKQPVRQALVRTDTDWPRSSGVCVVTDATFGQREFAIYVDAFSQFTVFPTSKITAANGLLQNVDQLYVKTVKPTLPSWVYQMPQKFSDWYTLNSTPGLVEFPEIDWKIHPDGIKACAVVYERNAVTLDTAWFGGYVGLNPGIVAGATADFNAYLPTTGCANTFDTSNTPQRYIVGTGLLELTMTIALTGNNPEDFTFVIAVAELRRPTTSPYCSFIAGYTWYDIPDQPASGFAGGVGVNTPVAATYFAKRGDLCALDIANYYSPTVVTGITFPVAGFTSFSLKNLTAVTEINAYSVASLTDFDMTTLSFALKSQVGENFNQTLNVRANHDGSPTFPTYANTLSAQFTIAHPGIAIYTFNKLREVLCPSTMSDANKTAVTAALSVPYATFKANRDANTYMPLNDVRDWSTLNALREYIVNAYFYEVTLSPVTPSTADGNWFGMHGYGDIYLTYIVQPHFGWYMYGDAIERMLRKTTASTLWAHPNGSWAYFDPTHIYNRNGIRVPTLAHYDTLSFFDAAKLENFVCDRVHLSGGTAAGLDTSFIALYNAAILKSLGPNVLTEPFTAISQADFAPTFTKQTYAYTVAGSIDSLNNGSVVNFLQIKMDFPDGHTAYYVDQSYQGGNNLVYTSDPSNFTTSEYQGGGSFSMQLDALFYSAPNAVGSIVSALDSSTRVAFCSPVLITAS
jgi:hypothetical protein